MLKKIFALSFLFSYNTYSMQQMPEDLTEEGIGFDSGKTPHDPIPPHDEGYIPMVPGQFQGGEGWNSPMPTPGSVNRSMPISELPTEKERAIIKQLVLELKEVEKHAAKYLANTNIFRDVENILHNAGNQLMRIAESPQRPNGKRMPQPVEPMLGSMHPSPIQKLNGRYSKNFVDAKGI